MDRINKSEVWKDCIEEVLYEIKQFTGIEAIAIRLIEGEDFPYYVTKGFPAHFVEAEKYLCTRDSQGEITRDSNGKPYVECMCGNVICGRTEDSKDFFTEGGSFWCNNTSKLLSETTDEDRQTRTRNRCNSEGYESVGLFPLRSGNEILGLLQINDKRLHQFTENNIKFFEEIGLSIGSAFSKKRVEDALLEREKKHRSILGAMKDAAYICSSDFHIEYMSPKMVSRVGHEAIGELCYKTIYNNDEKCSWCAFDQIKQGEHVDYELLNPLDNRYYSVANFPINNSNEHISKLTIFRDITENKDIEKQLFQARKMESIGTLAGGIAHDFNNLLFMIIGNTELALENIPEWNPMHESLEEIKSACLRASGVVKQLLNFSRKTDQNLKPIGAVTVIKDAMKFLRSTIPSTVELKLNVPDTDISIQGDPVQINQVMMNLCTNASQVMQDTGGTIEVDVETMVLNKEDCENYTNLTAGNHIKITINDSGPGIAPEIIDRIFDPYFTTKEFGAGSGMGLAVVHGNIKNHNGDISVDSKPGKGATFNILLPLIDELPEPEIKVMEDISHGSEAILFVDDEESIANMARKILKRLGYKIEVRLSPVEALELFKLKPDSFDMVITDMTMPQMTGIKLAKKLKAIRPDILIIICTGHSAIIDEEKAKQAGIDGFVMKPMSKLKFAKVIRDVLNKKY
ncbi:MAG: response regulator [Desulfobacteraceae bacterium]|nr:response regulator [Desulfobacteraceae bacterium]